MLPGENDDYYIMQNYKHNIVLYNNEVPRRDEPSLGLVVNS